MNFQSPHGFVSQLFQPATIKGFGPLATDFRQEEQVRRAAGRVFHKDLVDKKSGASKDVNVV